MYNEYSGETPPPTPKKTFLSTTGRSRIECCVTKHMYL